MKKYAYPIIGILIVVVFISGCLYSVPQQRAAVDPGINITNYPRVDGSTSTHPLAVLIACKFLNVSYTWNVSDNFPMFGTYERDLFTIDEPGSKEARDFIHAHVARNGTHGAYVNLISRTTDLILVARQPSPDELALAKYQNVELFVKPVALDAFVFLLNRNNTVDDLTVDQIRAIYRGDITSWSQVGGNASKIKAYQREANSGSEELMRTLVMMDEPTITVPDMTLYTMMGPINQLSRDVDGLCYSVYYYKEYMSYGKNIKTCAINGVYPDHANISSRKYPLTSEVYVVIRKDLDKKSSAYKMYDWLLSDQGQAVVRESGYVPIAK